jgi:hypothetical protein
MRLRSDGDNAVFERRRLAGVVALSIMLVAGSVAVATAPSGGAAPARRLGTLYYMKLHNSVENRNATGVLTGIKETKSGKISGKLTLAPPLYGGGPFRGTVGKTAVQFTVASTPGNPCHCVSIAFSGSIGPRGSMSGTYVATTTSGTENGTWRASPHETFACHLQSRANRKFVTAELTYPGAVYKGMLRARSDVVGTWQMFRCVAIGADQWALKSRANGKFVTAELGFPGALKGLLRATANKVGPAERFKFRPVLSCSCYALKAANSKIVSVEPSRSSGTRGLLRAHGTTVGSRQEFDITST